MPDMGISEIIALISAGIGAAGTGYSIYEQRAQGDAQQQAQRRAQQQAQQQAMAQRRQQMMREGPSLQSQVGGSLTPQSFNAMTAALTGNPGMAAGGGGGGTEASLTPAMENLFPSGGVPSLTEPWPTNV